MSLNECTTLLALLTIAFGAQPTGAAADEFARPRRPFTLSTPGVASEAPNTLLVAAQLNNNSHQRAFRVSIQSIRLDSAPLLTPVPLPVGSVPAGRSAVVQASFDRSRLVRGRPYRLVMRGTYQVAHRHDRDREGDDGEHGGRDDHHGFKRGRHEFLVKTVLILPPAAPGSASLGIALVPSSQTTGVPFPERPPEMDDEVNAPRWTVPTAPFEPGGPPPGGTSILPAPSAPAPAMAPAEPDLLAPPPPPIVFNANRGTGLTSAGIGCSGDASAACAEPTGASGGGVILMAANWSVAYSTDGGATFTRLNPTTIFPNDAVGFCCDQIIQYIPSIDRFVWLLQGNGYRMAVASPATIIASGGTAWTYWNLTPNVFGGCTSFDYPDLSVGDNQLYLSWDAGSGCSGGFQVVRTSFTGLQAGGTITVEFTDPANGPMAWGSHLTQNTGDEIFWAGHNSNKNVRVFSLKEGSNTYFWRDRGIASWANNAPTSTTPDGQDWLAKNFNGPGGNSFPRNGLIGATRSGNQLWLAWSAGTDSNFKQAHVEMVTFDRGNNFSKVQQVQIWNDSYAFAYPALATNACTGEVGMSFEYGGNGNYENHVVGFWGDFVAYVTTGSSAGTDRLGDYVTIRRAPATSKDPGNLFTAFGFGVNQVPPPGTGRTSDVRYVLFGRPSSSCVIIQ